MGFNSGFKGLNCRLPSEYEVKKINVIGLSGGNHEHEIFSSCKEICNNTGNVRIT
jgi:uncharacterized alpha/beta hydrolase family protein